MQDHAIIKDKEILLHDIEDVRTQITELLMEVDHITLQVNPRIEVDYAIKIGCYENELLQAQIEARRAKHRFELAQARLNRGETVSDEDINQELDKEFEVWEAQLAIQVQDYLAKLETNAGTRTLFPHEQEEMRSLHRELVKRLHPDLHSHQTEEEKRLFNMMQEAYKKGSLEMLRSIEVATAHLAKDDIDGEEAVEALSAELELLGAQLSVLQDQLEALKSTPPYTFADRLADSGWVHRRTQELKHEIDEQQAVCKAYDANYKELKEALDAR